jgi:hypothetical protein
MEAIISVVFKRPETQHIDRVGWCRYNTLEIIITRYRTMFRDPPPHLHPVFAMKAAIEIPHLDQLPISFDALQFLQPEHLLSRHFCGCPSSIFRDDAATFQSPMVGICTAKFITRKFAFCLRGVFAYSAQSHNKRCLFTYTVLTAPYNGTTLCYLYGTN